MKYCCLLLVLGCLLSCSGKKHLVKEADYSMYLKEGVLEKPVQLSAAEIKFWEARLQADTGSFVAMLKLGAAQQHYFKLTGTPRHLVMADSLFARSSVKLNDHDPEILYTRAQTAITRHRFAQAATYNDAAVNAQGDPYIHQLIGFDSGMELGQYWSAIRHLDSISDPSSFDYLIRKAKFEDHQGHQDRAIQLMEKAVEMVRGKKKGIYCWTLCNLADMYGHAGRPEKAYKAYLSVLEKDPAYLYALKGIAWIAFSHDRDSRVALQILNYIQRQTQMPDLWLMKAEIKEWEGDQAGKAVCLQRFKEETAHSDNGDMYNKYLIGLLSGEYNDVEKALSLALRETKNRPTPETFDWLAWVYYQNGQSRKALEIVMKNVYRQTSEPASIFHTAMIMEANGKNAEALGLFKECTGSYFELGPLKEKIIRDKINTLSSM